MVTGFRVAIVVAASLAPLSAASASAGPRVDMLALGEPVCDAVAAEIEVGASASVAPAGRSTLLENTLQIGVGLSEAVSLSVRLDSTLPLGSTLAAPSVGGVGGHAFWMLAQSDRGERGLALGADIARESGGATVVELGLAGALRGSRLTLGAGAGAALDVAAGADAPDAFATAAVGYRLAGTAAALFEVRAEGGASPFALMFGPGFTWHPSDTTKLLVAAPIAHDGAGWSAAFQLSFAATWGLAPEVETVAAFDEP